MAKKPAKRAKKASVKDLEVRKAVKGGAVATRLASTRMGVGRPLGIT